MSLACSKNPITDTFSVTLSTDSVLRTAFYDHTKAVLASMEEKKAKAKARFDKAATQGGKIVERLASASDDCTG